MMKESDWRRFEDGDPPEDLYPILVAHGSDKAIVDTEPQLEANRLHLWTHWQPYVAPRAPDTALGLLREAWGSIDFPSSFFADRVSAFLHANEDDS